MPGATVCPICQLTAEQRVSGDGVLVRCNGCGVYRLSRTASVTYERSLREDAIFRWVVSHAVRRMQREGGDPPLITTTILEHLQYEHLPSPKEQVDTLIRHFGAVIPTPEMP